jgi:hypothetical protein
LALRGLKQELREVGRHGSKLVPSAPPP